MEIDLERIKADIADEFDMPDWVKAHVADLILEVERLTQREHKLNALETYGVDNWEGYEPAMNDEEGEFD
jgi:hypothetical protein